MGGRAYNPDEIRAVAGKIGGLAGQLTSAGDGITGIQGASPFGNLPSSGTISSALSSFGEGLKSEFTAGARLMSSTEKSLHETAKGMDDDEDATVRSFGGNRPE